MKQGRSILRKKSNTNVHKVIFPFSDFSETGSKKQINLAQFTTKKQLRFAQPDNQSKYQSKKYLFKPKSLSQIKRLRTNSFSKFIQPSQKDDQTEHGEPRRNQTHKKTNFLLIDNLDNAKKYQHRFLSKERSFTNVNTFARKQQKLETNVFKKRKKERSLTKLESEWAQGRQIQVQKEKQQLHKFDQQKIDRTYDHLGKLKKATINKGKVKKFVSFKTIHRQMDQIDKVTFEQASKQFHKKFKQVQPTQQREPLDPGTDPKDSSYNMRKTPSPMTKKKNYMKITPSHGHKKEVSPTHSKKQKHLRVSADQQLFMTRQQNDSIENLSNEDSFYSQHNVMETANDANELVKMQSNDRSIKRLEEEESLESEPNFLEKAGISQNSQTFIFDKVYFFSSRLSSGFASLFSIERINLKSKAHDSFAIEVVIKAYEQIVVQKIVYTKNKRCETFKKLKPILEKDQEKQKLKTELFSQLIIKKQMAKNRQSVPESLHMTSQKQNILRGSQINDLFMNLHNFSGHTIEGIRNSKESNGDGNTSKSGASLMNFSKVSPQCYQSIIEYIQRFCNLQVSYLGASLKESEFPIPLMNQLMKKKHSQIQQTLLQSLNLAKVFYFLIKINTTYYIAKTVIIANKKIKHYLLYEFSNMIRHEKGCIIEEEEEVKEGMGKMRKGELVGVLFGEVNRFFMKEVMRNWRHNSKGSSGSNNQKPSNKRNQTKAMNCFQSNVPLINALQLCFGTIREIGLACDINVESERLYRIIQSNYRNDIRWQKEEFIYSGNPNYENFFQIHNAFDYELVPSFSQQQKDIGGTTLSSFPVTNRIVFSSSFEESQELNQRTAYRSNYSYKISKKFQIYITLYPSAIKSKHQLVRLHPTKLRDYKIEDHFRKEQLLLLHILQDRCTSSILNTFLKKQYILSISRKIRQTSIANLTPFFTVIQNKKYYVNVYVPFLQQLNPWKNKKYNLMNEMIYIHLQSRTSVKRYSVHMTLGDVFLEMKEYHRLYADARSYRKFVESINKAKNCMYLVTKEFFVSKLKFYVSKLFLMKKNTYSHFYFIPLPNLVSQASYKSSLIETSPKQPLHKLETRKSMSNSFMISENHKALVLQALQKLQSSLKQQEKSSRSTLSKIKIKNFPTYQIYFKTTRKLFPGYFIIISIYYMPIFDLSEIKLYLTKIHKSFFVSIRKNVDSSQYENIVLVLVEFLKDKFFSKIIAKEAEKLSSKYRDFYSRMIKQAESPFISKTRKNKETLGPFMNVGNKRNRHARKNYTINQVDFKQMTEELLCKVFQSRRHNKYLIRLSYPSSDEYVSQTQRKGIDELINISILKQNCMLIYKFQTTARKLLSKKVTHKFNVIQLEYQEKSKPFYILFEEIKILIEESDESTYGLLNTFRSYFMNKHYNTLTNNNLASMFSINLLAGLSNTNLLGLGSDNNFLGATLNRIQNPYNFDTQKELNIKDLNSNLYQRFCLFIQDNQMLEVLKIRNQTGNRPRCQVSGAIQSSKSNTSEDPRKSKPFAKRASGRKQSIEAYLVHEQKSNSPDMLTSLNNQIKKPIIRKYSPDSSTLKNPTSLTKPKLDFILQNEYFIHSHTTQSDQPNSKHSNLEEKIVFLINTETQFVNQIHSSMEDQGFTINVPFGKYNKKMFKRFFKSLVRQGKEEDGGHQFIMHEDNLSRSQLVNSLNSALSGSQSASNYSFLQ